MFLFLFWWVNGMISEAHMLAQIEAANQFIDKSYLESLQDYHVKELADYLKRHNLTRLFHIQKIVYDKNEDVNEKLISVFHAVMPFCKNLLLIVKGSKDHADLYLGIRASQTSNAAVAGDILHDSFLGNFPGSKIAILKMSQIDSIFDKKDDSISFPSKNIAYMNIIPSERTSKKGEYIQGLEKFIDTMRGNEYICEIIAAPVTDSEIEYRLNGFEELYSALYPFSKRTSSHGHNEGATLTEGITNSISDSISNGISKATGRSNGHTYGQNSGFNMGAHMLLNFGISKGTQESWSNNSNESTTNTNNATKTTSSSRQQSESKTTGTSDNLTIEFRDKGIEDLLEKIERHIKRLKAGSSYGVWEVASYFFATEKKTAAIAASSYRALLLGEETYIEKSNFTLFDSDNDNTSLIADSLHYCEHPVFLIPNFNSYNTSENVQALSPTSYINGKELAQLLNLPRKSVAGIMVTEMAEFGRNVLTNLNDYQREITLGQIYHMGQQEDSLVKLNIDSLTSHCFITGSTGSGKSNTVYKLIEEIAKDPYNIPFLVIEPAKGEYRNEFRSIPNCNLFSTNPQIDQMLKLNPFAFCDGIHILEHLDRIVEIFNGCWEMYAAMPAILKEAIENAYISKGWDLLNSIYMEEGSPVFPTFTDVLQELPKVINSSEYSADTKGDYIGALVTRVNSMTNGIYGQIFCDEFEVDSKTLFDEITIIDLSRIGSSETKSLIMGILVLKLTEYRMANANQGNSALRHLTILEEAHNILKNQKNSQGSAGNNVIAKSVEMIVSSIAEMRTYGEGFVIVDQSPTSVDIAAIKNTNTKIVMRLPDDEDCKIAGHSVSLNEQQTAELARLGTGVAVVMQNNWSVPVLSKISKAMHPFESYETPVSLKKLKEFRSIVLSELINQFEQTDEQNIGKVLQKVESFDISSNKKREMSRMLLSFNSVMKNGYDSILLGRTVLRLIGCDDAFRKAEQYLKYQTDDKGELIAQYTAESLSEWSSYIHNALSQYVSVDNECRSVVQQYILHSKKFEQHSIDYRILYHQIYNPIK